LPPAIGVATRAQKLHAASIVVDSHLDARILPALALPGCFGFQVCALIVVQLPSRLRENVGARRFTLAVYCTIRANVPLCETDVDVALTVTV